MWIIRAMVEAHSESILKPTPRLFEMKFYLEAKL